MLFVTFARYKYPYYRDNLISLQNQILIRRLL